MSLYGILWEKSIRGLCMKYNDYRLIKETVSKTINNSGYSTISEIGKNLGVNPSLFNSSALDPELLKIIAPNKPAGIESLIKVTSITNKSLIADMITVKKIPDLKAASGDLGAYTAKPAGSGMQNLLSLNHVDVASINAKLNAMMQALQTYNINTFDIDEENITEEIKTLDEQEKEVVQNSVPELIVDLAENRYEAFNRKMEKLLTDLKSNHFIFYVIIHTFITVFLSSAASDWGAGVTRNVVNTIREAPASYSNKTDSLPANTYITILEDERYYYKVLYSINEDGTEIEKEGYLSKRSVFRIEEDIIDESE